MKKFVALMAIVACLTAANALPPQKVTIPVFPSQDVRYRARNKLSFYKEPAENSPRLIEIFKDKWNRESSEDGLAWNNEPLPNDFDYWDVKASDWITLEKSAGWLHAWHYDRMVWIHPDNYEIIEANYAPIKVDSETNIFKLSYPPHADYAANISVFVRPTGRYKGVCAFCYKWGGVEGVMIGAIINNMAVFPAFLPAKVECTLHDPRGFSVTAPQSKGDKFSVKYGYAMADNSELGGTLDFNELTDQQLVELLKHTNDISSSPLIAFRNNNGWLASQMIFDADDWVGDKITVPFAPGNYDNSPAEIKGVESPASERAKQIAEMVRTINSPKVTNNHSKVEVTNVKLTEGETAMTIRFIPRQNFQYNINRDAYLTCDVNNEHYPITRVNGANLSPRPTQARAGVEEVITLYFRGVPLESTVINLVEGPSRDNINIDGIQVPLPSDANPAAKATGLMGNTNDAVK